MSLKEEMISEAAALVFKAAVLAAQWAGGIREKHLKEMTQAGLDDTSMEILLLKERVAELEGQVALLLERLKRSGFKPRYSRKERLFVLWHMDYFRIPRNRVAKYFGVARSTLYRWLHRVDDEPCANAVPANKTPAEIVSLVWEIAKDNIHWGRVKIANQLALLGVFISASTVRNILLRPRPRDAAAECRQSVCENNAASRAIPAWFPNHVWSVDLTLVFRWGLWPTYVLVAIDHFSRKVLAALPLEGPNAGWVVGALEEAFECFGAPRHIVTDRYGTFSCEAFAALLSRWNVKHRFGAVGKHGSISVTERVIETLKYEWLKRVSLIRGFSHLQYLCDGFLDWYNAWRPHMSIYGLRPDDVFYRRKIRKPNRNDKSLPRNIERRSFSEARVIGYRLKQAA